MGAHFSLKPRARRVAAKPVRRWTSLFRSRSSSGRRLGRFDTYPCPVSVFRVHEEARACVIGHGGGGHTKVKTMKPKELLAELQTTLERFLR